MYIRLSLVLILSAGIVAFALQNAVPVDVNLWFWKVESSLAMLMFSCIAGGVIISGLLGIPGMLKKRKEISSLKTRLKSLSEEIENLKKEHSSQSEKQGKLVELSDQD